MKLHNTKTPAPRIHGCAAFDDERGYSHAHSAQHPAALAVDLTSRVGDIGLHCIGPYRTNESNCMLDYISGIESSVRGYVRSFPTVFSSASGCWLTNEEGRRYLDFFSGAGALNYGHNNPLVKTALIEYISRDGVQHSLDMATEAKIAFLHAFEENILKPRSLDYRIQFTGPTGTNAVEAAMLHRGGDYILLEGRRFPRLKAASPQGKLAETIEMLRTF